MYSKFVLEHLFSHVLKWVGKWPLFLTSVLASKISRVEWLHCVFNRSCWGINHTLSIWPPPSCIWSHWLSGWWSRSKQFQWSCMKVTMTAMWVYSLCCLSNMIPFQYDTFNSSSHDLPFCVIVHQRINLTELTWFLVLGILNYHIWGYREEGFQGFLKIAINI